MQIFYVFIYLFISLKRNTLNCFLFSAWGVAAVQLKRRERRRLDALFEPTKNPHFPHRTPAREPGVFDTLPHFFRYSNSPNNLPIIEPINRFNLGSDLLPCFQALLGANPWRNQARAKNPRYGKASRTQSKIRKRSIRQHH